MHHTDSNRVSRVRRRVLWASAGIFCAGGLFLLGRLLLTPSAAERFERALAACDAGDFKVVREEAAALRQLTDYEAEADLLAGLLALRSGRLQEAVATLESSRNDPDIQGRAWTITGEAFFTARQLDEARRALETAVHYDPDQVQAHRLLGATLYDLGAMGRAIEHLEKTAALDLDDPRPHRLIGLIYKDYERYGDAVIAYRESLRRTPHRDLANDVRYELAECLIAQRNYTEAQAVLRESPRLPDIRVLEAECHVALGEPERAQALVQQVLDVTPDHVGALMMMATIAMEDRRFDEAIATLERAREIEPGDPIVHMKLAQAYRQNGDAESADTSLEEMQRLRDLKLQFSELHQQTLNDVTNADLRFQLGELANKLGRPDLARVWFEAALALAPSHTRARKALRELESRP